MNDFFAFLNGADGKLSWSAALGLFLFVILAMIVAAKVPFLRKLGA